MEENKNEVVETTEETKVEETKTECISEDKYKKLHNDCRAIGRVLVSPLKTIKANNKF